MLKRLSILTVFLAPLGTQAQMVKIPDPKAGSSVLFCSEVSISETLNRSESPARLLQDRLNEGLPANGIEVSAPSITVAGDLLIGCVTRTKTK